MTRTASNSSGGAPVPAGARVLVVCAHPDDESFGLGALIAATVRSGSVVDLLCLTRGSASTLGAGADVDLAAVRSEELACAAEVLGVASTWLLDHPDGGLERVPLAGLAADVTAAVARTGAELLLVFDRGGVTGHPDHARATHAAVEVARERGLGVLAWVLPDAVARQLNHEFGTAFAGRPPGRIDVTLEVDRATQRRAIACHRSQERDNPVLHRRLQLLGVHEHVSWLVPDPRPA